MKIAFDVDGVITENPSFYAVVTKALMNDPLSARFFIAAED